MFPGNTYAPKLNSRCGWSGCLRHYRNVKFLCYCEIPDLETLTLAVPNTKVVRPLVMFPG